MSQHLRVGACSDVRCVCLRRYVCKQTFGDIQAFLKVRFVKLGEAHQVGTYKNAVTSARCLLMPLISCKIRTCAHMRVLVLTLAEHTHTHTWLHT